jgi:hypothetical protein
MRMLKNSKKSRQPIIVPTASGLTLKLQDSHEPAGARASDRAHETTMKRLPYHNVPMQVSPPAADFHVPSQHAFRGGERNSSPHNSFALRSAVGAARKQVFVETFHWQPPPIRPCHTHVMHVACSQASVKSTAFVSSSVAKRLEFGAADAVLPASDMNVDLKDVLRADGGAISAPLTL